MATATLILTTRPQRRNHLLPRSPAPLPTSPCSPCTYVEISLHSRVFFLQNKPNFKMGNINITTAILKAYANEQRTMSNERYSKQTQQVLSGVEGTNPIPPPPSCAGKESRISERNAYPDLSGRHQRSRIKHLPHLTTESWRYCAKQTQFPKGQNQCNPLCRKGLRK